MAILTSLESWHKSKKSHLRTPYNYEIMKRLKGVWFASYLTRLVHERKILANKNNTAARD